MGFLWNPLNPMNLTCGLTAAEATQGKEQGKDEMTGWQWHQLDRMQIVCTSLQADNHASTHHSILFTDRMPFLCYSYNNNPIK